MASGLEGAGGGGSAGEVGGAAVAWAGDGGLELDDIMGGATAVSAGGALSADVRKWKAAKAPTIPRRMKTGTRYFPAVAGGVPAWCSARGDGIFFPQTGHLKCPFVNVCTMSSKLYAMWQCGHSISIPSPSSPDAPYPRCRIKSGMTFVCLAAGVLKQSSYLS